MNMFGPIRGCSTSLAESLPAGGGGPHVSNPCADRPWIFNRSGICHSSLLWAVPNPGRWIPGCPSGPWRVFGGGYEPTSARNDRGPCSTDPWPTPPVVHLWTRLPRTDSSFGRVHGLGYFRGLWRTVIVPRRIGSPPRIGFGMALLGRGGLNCASTRAVDDDVFRCPDGGNT